MLHARLVLVLEVPQKDRRDTQPQQPSVLLTNVAVEEAQGTVTALLLVVLA